MLNKKIVTSRAIGILAILLLWCALYSQVKDPVVLIDTVFTETSPQGAISYYLDAGVYLWGNFSPGDYYFYVGDWYDQWYYNDNVATRAYLSFPVQPIPENYQIDSISIQVYQLDSYDDDSSGFPYWDTDPPEYFPCNIYHVDFGTTIEPDDFDPVIYSLIGAISINDIHGWKHLEVTNAYLQDLSQSRTYFQVMIKFPILSDYDGLSDGIHFSSSFSPVPIHLVIHYSPIIGNCDEIASPDRYINLYPNPCREQFTITSNKNTTIQSVELFNNKGQKVATTIISSGKTNEVICRIDRKTIPAGIYLVKSTLNNSHSRISKVIIY